MKVTEEELANSNH